MYISATWNIFQKQRYCKRWHKRTREKNLYLRRNAGISSRISAAGSESEIRGGFSLPLSPQQCTQGERVKDGGQIGCISTEVIRTICVMWLQTEQTAEISPMLPGETNKYPTYCGPLHCYVGNWALRLSDSII